MGGTRQRHTVVVVVVVVCVCVCVSFDKILFAFSLPSLNAMLSLVNFGLETLLSSYGVICSPSLLVAEDCCIMSNLALA